MMDAQRTPRILQIVGGVCLLAAGGVILFWLLSGAHMVTQEEQTRTVTVVDGLDELDDDEFEDFDAVADELAELYAAGDQDDDEGDTDGDPFEDEEDPFGDEDPFEDEEDPFEDEEDPFGDEDPFEDEEDPFGDEDPFEDEADSIDEEDVVEMAEREGAEIETREEVIREAQFGLFPDRGYDGAAPLAGFFFILGVALLIVGRRMSSAQAERASEGAT